MTSNGNTINYCVNVASDISCYHFNHTCFYCLDNCGVFYTYMLSIGNLSSIHDLYKTLPKTLQFHKLHVNTKGSEIGLLASNNHVYILTISPHTRLPTEQQQHVLSSKSSSASVSSFKTMTSRTSNYSRMDSLRREVTNKKVSSVANASTANSSWLSYLETLTLKKKIQLGEVEDCHTFICIQDIPAHFTVHTLQFCQESLCVQATHPDGTSDGFYRVYDKSNGQLDSIDILAADTCVVPVFLPGISLPFLVQASHLYLPLGIVSRDSLIQKMIGGENESEVDEMIGQAVSPLLLLEQGLRSKQLDMVRLALNLNTQGFKSQLSSVSEDVLVVSVQQLFSMVSALVEEEGYSGNAEKLQRSWEDQVRRLALTHANTLLSLLTSPHLQLQVEILQQIVSLRGEEIEMSVELPIIPQWSSWISLSDEEVMLHSMSSPSLSLPLVQCFLMLHRGWKHDHLTGPRFNNTVHRVVCSLIGDKKIEETTRFLSKMGFNPDEQLRNMCLECREPPLRDYLVSSPSVNLSNEADKVLEAWQFLTLVESVLIGSDFPPFVLSPWNISDVLSFSLNDKAHIVADLYFSTGDLKLEPLLNKAGCWDYFLLHNYTDGILTWLDPKHPPNPDNRLALDLSKCNLDRQMVGRIQAADCTDLSKHIICNKLATYGIFLDTEMSQMKNLLQRLAYAEVFPEVKSVLSQEDANLSHSQLEDKMIQYSIENGLVDLAVKFDLIHENCIDSGPAWLKLYKSHVTASKTLSHSEIEQAIEDTTQYLAQLESRDSNLFLKQHPIVAVVTSILRNQDIFSSHSHVSPLLSPPTPPLQEDITLYSILAHTVPFHTDNIFRYQIHRKQNKILPDFRSEKLSLRHGIQYSLGFKEFLKQGRAGSAFMSIMHKGKYSVKKKAVVNQVHGLALSNFKNSSITSACVAFVELLGSDSSLVRTHVAVARELSADLSDPQLRETLLCLAENNEAGSLEMLKQLEDIYPTRWKAERANVVRCVQDFHLGIRLAVSHGLPAPTSLLRYCLDQGDWLAFVLVAQLFQFPLTMVQDICTSSTNPVISKHLYYALQSCTKTQNEKEMVKPFEGETDLFSCLAYVGNDAQSLFVLSNKLGSPVLALLAASIQPGAAIEEALSWWLLASLAPADAPPSSLGPPWTPLTVNTLMEHVVTKGYFRTLVQGFFIFQPVNPLCALASFFVDTVVERKFKESILNLKLFMAAYSNLPNESAEDTSFLMSKSWISQTAFRLACTALTYCFPSGYFRCCFLKTLCDAQFSKLTKEAQSLPLLLRLSECLADTTLRLDWQRVCLDQDMSQLSEVLYNLTKLHLFDSAFKFAHTAGLPVDHVLVTQWTVLAQSDERKGRSFWQKCEDAFQQASIDPEVGVSFYKDQAATCSDLHERYILLKFAFNWIRKTSSTVEDITALQLEFYMTCLQEFFKMEVVTEGQVPSPLRCLSGSLVVTPSQVVSPPQLNSCQTHRLDDLIHQLLIFGDIQTAFQVQALFRHTNQDCELLLACMRLAEGITTVTNLPIRIQEYLATESVRRPKINFASPLPKRQSQNNLTLPDDNSVLNALYTLQAHQICPTPLFSNIISGYKLSLALSCTYQEVILDAEPLGRLLTSHDYEVATALLNLASLSPYECTQYVCSQVLSALNSDTEHGKYTLWDCDLDTEYSCILDLSGSPLLLGNLLLASDLPSSVSSNNLSYKQGVEVLVLAHSCFTRVCHMEGIVSVLSLARSLVNRLLDHCQWPLMVRLLTGIGRYTELRYIFQILKDHDQFEYLLGKGLDKLPQLMSALLEFVRNDHQLFSLVAHHFSMYSELAALYEGEARAELRKLDIVAGTLVPTANNKDFLLAAMTKYTDATEHYIQAKKMNCGVSTMQQAELLALQLSLLNDPNESSVPCLVNLTNKEAINLVNTVLSCEQSHIVASAYNVSVDWGAALYNNYVVRGDTNYLVTWLRRHQLNMTIVQDIVRRFQSEKEPTPSVEVNMKRLVSSVSLLDIKYRVASQLGFKDILQNLLSTPDMAYLKDTVWKSGYKSQSC